MPWFRFSPRRHHKGEAAESSLQPLASALPGGGVPRPDRGRVSLQAPPLGLQPVSEEVLEVAKSVRGFDKLGLSADLFETGSAELRVGSRERILWYVDHVGRPGAAINLKAGNLGPNTSSEVAAMIGAERARTLEALLPGRRVLWSSGERLNFDEFVAKHPDWLQ